MRRIPPVLMLTAAVTVSARDRSPGETTHLTPGEAIGTPEVRVRLVVRQSKDRFEKRDIISLDSAEEFHDP